MDGFRGSPDEPTLAHRDSVVRLEPGALLDREARDDGLAPGATRARGGALTVLSNLVESVPDR